MTTSSPIPLATAKAHLKVEHAEDDALIDGLLVAASQWFEKETGSLLADLSDVPQLVKQCVLLLVTNWYEERSAASPLTIKTVPLAVESIVAQYAKPESI